MAVPPPQGLSIALVSTEQDWGGGEEQARLLAEGLRRRGNRCTVFARSDGRLARRMAEAGFPLVGLSGSGRNPASLWRIRQHLRRLRPDVLHYNDSHALTAAGLAALGLGIPARIAARRVLFPLRWRLPYRRLADRVVCVSRAVAAVCRSAGLPERVLRVVYDGVDPDRVAGGDRQRGRRSLGIADAQLLLLTVAKLTDCKGHAFLLEALLGVFQRYPQAIAVLAGDGPLRGALHAHAARLGIGEKVRLVGHRQDVPDLIQAADLFVLPSDREGLCSTLIDVMLAGRPIVTTCAGGIPELVGSGAPLSDPVAWTVPPRDPKALAAAVLSALDHPDQCAAFVAGARQRAEHLFTADRMVDATLQVYREVLEGYPNGRSL